MNSSKPGKLNRKDQFWMYHINNWETSGLSQAKYCKRNNLALSTFSYRRSKINKKPETSVELVQIKSTPVHIPVSPQPTQNQAGVPLKLKIRNTIEIEVADGFSPYTLKHVMGVLGDYL